VRGGRRLVCGSTNGTVRVWDVPRGREALGKGEWTGQFLHHAAGHGQGINAVAVSRDGKMVATGGSDATVRLWKSAKGGKELRRFDTVARVTSVALTADGKLLAAADNDDNAFVWEVATGKKLHRFSGRCVAFSPDGKRLAVGGFAHDRPGSNRGLVVVHDLAKGNGNGKEACRLEGHLSYVMCVAFSPDGKQLASGSQGMRLEGKGQRENEVNTIRLWDLTSGKPLRAFGGNQLSIGSLAFSPDGRTLAAAGWTDGGSTEDVLCLWDVATGVQRRRLKGHSQPVASVAFAPDGRRIVSGSWDQTVRLWDPVTGKELRRLEGHRNHVSAVAFSGDGKVLVTASQDTTALVWDVARLLKPIKDK
jgi:WD40 repeat protein